MKLTTFNLTNFRGIDTFPEPLEFDEKMNVIFGANGAGKSTILDGLAIMLSWAVNRIRHAGASGRHIGENEIKNGTSYAMLELAANGVSWKLVKNRKGHGQGTEKSDFTALNDYAKALQNSIRDSLEPVNIPLFVYYPINRAVVDIPLRIRKRHEFDALSAYDEALSGGANFRTFFEWFREHEDLENESLRNATEEERTAGAYLDPQLQSVRRALEHFMPEFQNFRVRRNPLRMEVQKNGASLNVSQLSDGEKCLIAMIGDLARRMAIANPGLDDPLQGEGVVLIDEIDLHLHPKWQRMIVNKLPDIFENCQFIVTTHSPHVITHVQPENLYRLKQENMRVSIERPIGSYGKNVDRILEDLMGLDTTRPDDVKAKLEAIFVLISTGRLDEAKVSITTLQEQIGDDPELVKAGVLIKRKEAIGR